MTPGENELSSQQFHDYKEYARWVLKKTGGAVFFGKYRVIPWSLRCRGMKLLPKQHLEAWVKYVILRPHCTWVTPRELSKVQVAGLFEHLL